MVIETKHEEKDRIRTFDPSHSDEKSFVKTIDRLFEDLSSRYHLHREVLDRTDLARFILAFHEKIEEVYGEIEKNISPDRQNLFFSHVGTKVEEMLLHKVLEKTELLQLEEIERMVRTQTGSINGLTAYFDAPLSKGSSGILYRAVDPKGKGVVIKVLGMTSDEGDPKELKGRLWREVVAASMAALLKEPHIIKAKGDVFSFDPEVGFYLVLDDIQGYPLVNLLKQYRENPPKSRKQFLKVLIMARQIGEALQYLHAHGFHRLHLNPENVVVDAKGKVTLTGFGSVKRDTGTAYTSLGILSLPAYTSPEELRGGAKEGGPESDLWVLGVLIYELIAGDSPFLPGQTVMDILRLKLEDVKAPLLQRVAKSLSQVNPALRDGLEPREVEALEAILKDLLDDNPENRGTAEEFLLALGIAFPEVKLHKSGEVKFPDEMKGKIVNLLWQEFRKRSPFPSTTHMERKNRMEVMDLFQGWSIHVTVSQTEPKVFITVSLSGERGKTAHAQLDDLYQWMKVCLKKALMWIQIGKIGSMDLPPFPSIETSASKKEDIPILSRILSALQKGVLLEEAKEQPKTFDLETIFHALEKAHQTLLLDSRFERAEEELTVILNVIFGGYLKMGKVNGKTREEFLSEQLKRLDQFVSNPEHLFSSSIKKNLIPALEKALKEILKLK